MWGACYKMDDQDLNNRNVFLSTNHERSSSYGWLIESYARPVGSRVWGWRCYGRLFEGQAHCLGHRKLTRHFLRSLGNEVTPFWSPTVMETVGGELATARRPRRTLATVPASSGGASTPGMASTVVVTACGPPLRRNSARDTVEKWGDDGGSAMFLQWGNYRGGGRSFGSFVGVRVWVHAKQ
jgi:hypothetical protein